MSKRTDNHPERAETPEGTTVPCPHCGKAVVWDKSSPWRPFCSKRCRLIDLGDWFGETHAIPGEPGSPPDSGE